MKLRAMEASDTNLLVTFCQHAAKKVDRRLYITNRRGKGLRVTGIPRARRMKLQSVVKRLGKEQGKKRSNNSKTENQTTDAAVSLFDTICTSTNANRLSADDVINMVYGMEHVIKANSRSFKCAPASVRLAMRAHGQVYI